MRKGSNKQNQHGQSMIETALLFPILLVLFAGMIEVVFICRSYLVILDSSYQGAHLGSQGWDRYDDTEIKDLVLQDLPAKIRNNLTTDVIITRAHWNGTNLNLVINGIQYPKNMKGSSAVSIFKNGTLLTSRLNGHPATDLIAVEVVYKHPLTFNFPIIWDLLPDPFPLDAYTIQYVAR
jgi:Flp pilus assembly protein TadG